MVMEQALDFLMSVDDGGTQFSPARLALAMLLAFILGQVIATVYARTHSGLSYARSFTQSLVILTMVVALVVFTIGNNIVTAFGLVGALAIIRFRNVMKDTRDTVFVFISLAVGMGLGSYRIAAALIGTGMLVLVVSYMHLTEFGSRGHFDGHLTIRAHRRLDDDADFTGVMKRFCRRFQAVTKRHSHDIAEYVFQIRLRDPRRGGDLTSELQAVTGMGDVVLVLRDELTEV
jgi:hypothetical protein